MKTMNSVNNMLKMVIATLIFISCNVSAENSSTVWGYGRSISKNGPDNLIKAMTFVSTRPFNSVDGSFFRDGLAGGDGMYFFKQVLGLTDQQIEARRNAAIKFYNQRFGIDVNNPGVYFTGFQIDPATDYRAIMMTGKNNNPGKGYPVLEGGFIVVVTDPAGLDLEGEFQGTHVPAGTVFAAEGTYLIQRGHDQKDIVINFQSRGPNMPVGTGLAVNCEVSHPEWGNGVGWGYFELHKLKNGQISAQGRNVLTFPGLGIAEEKLVH